MASIASKLRRWAFVLPTISAASWLSMLAALFGFWYTSGEPRYTSEEDTQNIAYISDIGAQTLKPLFITCTSLSMATYIPTTTLYFRYLSPNDQARDSFVLSSSPSKTSWKSVHSIWTRVAIPLLSTLFSLLGATALILLTVFDTARYPEIHRSLLSTSIIMHLAGCALLCAWSFLRIQQTRGLNLHSNSEPNSAGDTSSTDKDNRDPHIPPRLPILMSSLIIKSTIVVSEFVVVVLFAIMTWLLQTYDIAAIMEWVVVLMFGTYVACQIGDFWVLRRMKKRRVEEAKGEEEVAAVEVMPIGVAI